jgi:hypothetical protein
MQSSFSPIFLDNTEELAIFEHQIMYSHLDAFQQITQTKSQTELLENVTVRPLMPTVWKKSVDKSSPDRLAKQIVEDTEAPSKSCSAREDRSSIVKSKESFQGRFFDVHEPDEWSKAFLQICDSEFC